MNEQELELLLSSMEGPTLDFKAKAYDFSYEPDGAKFIKDILCMANTPREKPSYIILGVKKKTDGSYELWGVDKHPDDDTVQSQFTERVRPIPTLTYDTFIYKGKSFGIIEIPPQHIGPHLPLKDFPSPKGGRSQTILRQNQVYFRRGSKNDIATTDDLKHISQWMMGGPSISFLPPESRGEAWEKNAHLIWKNQPTGILPEGCAVGQRR
jgi:predicted HTH transcriptional regulator